MTTNVNMKQAVPGATVHFRCGGSAVVASAPINALSAKGLMLKLGDTLTNLYFNWNGTRYDNIPHLLDIIRIDPPQFCEKDVKAGMAVEAIGRLHYYIGRKSNGNLVFEDDRGLILQLSSNSFNFTRAPEHDKVQS